MRIRDTLLFLAVLLGGSLHGQSLKRAVLSSAGQSLQGSGYYFHTTVAQPPNAGTISDGQHYLRQGFEQPLKGNCATAPQAIFTVDSVANSTCGLQYNFHYAGAMEPGMTFLWEFGDQAIPATSTLPDPQGVVFTFNGIAEVKLTVTAGDCTSSTTRTVYVSSTTFTASAQVMDVICFDDHDGSISLLISGGMPPYTVVWTTGDTGLVLTDLYPGLYGFTIIDAQDCMIEGNAEVQGPPALDVLLNVTDESCTDTRDGKIVAMVSGGVPPYALLWSTGSTDTEIEDLGKGTYGLTVTDASGCEKAIDSIAIKTLCTDLVMYEIFTPNGDGVNDTWVVEGIENFPDSQLEIFNRWGERVYLAIGYQNDWNGTTANGSELPAGTYYFILQLNDGTGTIHRGAITLLR